MSVTTTSAPSAPGPRSAAPRQRPAAATPDAPGTPYAADARVVLLRPVVTLLPPAATSLFTLLSVGPEAREAMFSHVAHDSARLDAARDRVMAQLTRLPERDRAAAIRLSQSAGLLGRLMVAVARVAAQGDVGRVPGQCPDLARELVGITEQVAAVDLGDSPRGRRARRLTLSEALRRLSEASDQLDQLMWRLTGHASTSGADPAGR